MPDLELPDLLNNAFLEFDANL